MALPTSREETCTPAGSVKANTINAIQDAIIGAKMAQQTRCISPYGGSPTNNTRVFSLNSGGISFDATTAAATWRLPLNFDVGDRIVNIRSRVQDAVGCTVSAIFTRSADNVNQLTTTQTSNNSGAIQTLTHTALNETIAAGKSYSLVFAASVAFAASMGVFQIEIDYDHP